jgi:hypothetical protein
VNCDDNKEKLVKSIPFFQTIWKEENIKNIVSFLEKSIYFSVSDPDWMRIQSGQWIRIRFGIWIRIQEGKKYPQK